MISTRSLIQHATDLLNGTTPRLLDRAYPDWYDWADFLKGRLSPAQKVAALLRDPSGRERLQRFIDRVEGYVFAHDSEVLHPADEAEEWNPEGVDLRWTEDGRHFRVVRLAWCDDASYARAQVDAGDPEPQSSDRARSHCPRCREPFVNTHVPAGTYFTGTDCAVCGWTIREEPIRRRPLPSFTPWTDDRLSRAASAVLRLRRSYAEGYEADARGGLPVYAEMGDAEERAAREAIWAAGLGLEQYNRELASRVSSKFRYTFNLAVDAAEADADALPF